MIFDVDQAKMNEDKQESVSTESTDLPTSTAVPTESLTNEEQKPRLSYDERRLSLLNNPIYGVILVFLDKFRSFIDIQDYPLHLLEENLLNDEENISRRLIDFHFNLLKRISLGKGAQRDKFVSIITKFAYRFDFDDGEYLRTNGYSHANVDVKLRILKNLLETQFDHNTAFKTAVLEKPSFEIRSQPLGRDRSGASYWLILDAECFMRLFRENIDEDRTWTNVAKDKDELESLIKLLITDNVIRKKFPEWKFAYEAFNALESSNEFQDRYAPVLPEIKKEELKPVEHRSKSPIITLKKERVSVPVPKKSATPSPPPVVSVKAEAHSDEESTNSHEKTPQHSSDEANSNVQTQEINNNQEETTVKKSARGRRKSKKRKSKSKSKQPAAAKDETTVKPVAAKGRKRKQIVDDANESIADTKKNDETSQDKPMSSIAIDDELFQDDSLPIALRRSRRTRKPPSTTSSPVKPVVPSPTKKKIANGKSKVSSQPKSKSRKGRRGRRRANGSSDDEQQPSEEEEEDEYNSDDYLPDPKQANELDDDELLEEDEDDEYVPRRSAKTVAKRRGQLNENNLIEDLSSAASECRVCSKSDRPEALLLCDDCDDPYHLECLKPSLLSVPDGDWFCPLCEHKRLCDNLIDKFQQFLKDLDELEAKKNQCMSKRSNRLANVMLNLDRMMKRSSKKRKTNGIVYSDEEEDEQEEEDEEQEEEEEQDDEDEDSVYGFKDDGSIDGADKPRRSLNVARGRRDHRRQSDEPQVLGVRSCRRKPQNYRFDDYDKKMKEAMMVDGEDDFDKESNESDENNDRGGDDDDNTSKKRAGYEKDEDFDVSAAKNDDEFAPDQNNSDGSGSEDEDEDYEDEESSDDKWKSKRRTSARRKQPTRSSTRRKSKKNSDDDDDDDESLSDTELENFQSFNTTNETDDLSDDRRRSSRATTQRNYAKDDDDSDEDYFENGRPPPRRMRYKKRRGSDDSFVDDDDDYEKIAQKRKIVKYSKSLHRSTITDRIRRLVDDDDEDEENENSAGDKIQSQGEMQVDEKQTNNQQESVENQKQQRPSDDDEDFPDEQEIFQANGLRKLQNSLVVPKPPALRPAFAGPMHSYQHAIIDPTARFAMIRPPIRPNGYPSNGHELTQQPSDSNQVNGHNSPTSSNFIIQDL